MKTQFTSLLLALMTFSPFSKYAVATTSSGKIAELKNESYGRYPAQKVDVYLPAGRSSTSTKVLVLLHGGAWNSGDKLYINDFVKLIQAHDPNLAIMNANYRLVSSSIHLAEQLDDIRQLMKFVATKSSAWNIDTSQVSLGGISAGAHLAMLYAYKYDADKKVSSVVSIVGPAYFGDAYYTANPLFQPLITNLLGKPVTDTAGYLEASPAYVVAAGAPPTYMAYGGYDPLVPVSNAIYLDKKLTELNVPHQYRFYPYESHRFSPAAYDTVAKEVAAFIGPHPELRSQRTVAPNEGGK